MSKELITKHPVQTRRINRTVDTIQYSWYSGLSNRQEKPLKKLCIDTNIVLDVLQNRQPNVVYSSRVLHLAREGTIALYATSECISTSWYVLARGGNKARARQHLRTLMEIIHIIPVSHRAVDLALSSDFHDVEDAILHFAALEHGDIDAIVTGNIRDFRNSVLPVLHPSKVAP